MASLEIMLSKTCVFILNVQQHNCLFSLRHAPSLHVWFRLNVNKGRKQFVFLCSTKPNKKLCIWINCVVLRELQCAPTLWILISCLCKAQLDALRNKTSKSACAGPCHISEYTLSMIMSRRSFIGGRLNLKKTVFSCVSNAATKTLAKYKCACFAMEARYIASLRDSTWFRMCDLNRSKISRHWK